jgi:tetratricopeptide (TPR) repeat protein
MNIASKAKPNDITVIGRTALLLRVMLFTALFMLIALPAIAQSLNIRSGLHEDYTRIVFDWSNAGVGAELIQTSPQTTEILFNSNASTLNQSALDLADSKHVSSFSVLTQAPMRVKINHPSGADLRVFNILNRVVVDIKADGVRNNIKQAAPPETKPEKVSQTPKRPQKKPNESADKFEAAREKAAENNIGLDVGGAKTITRVNDEPPAMDGEVKSAVAPNAANKAASLSETGQTQTGEEQSYFERLADKGTATAPHKVIIASTTSMDMGAFIRSGRLWLVLGQPDYYVTPIIRGANTDEFGDFTRMDVPEGTAFYLDLPKGREFFAQAEGGGLNWTVIISETRPKTKRKWPARNVDETVLRGGDSLVWQVPWTKRVVTFEDPFLGDEIRVALAGQADIYAGAAKSYVDFELLDSIVGMAIVPKVDDLKVAYDEKTITISRPNKLALMDPSDIRVYELTQDYDIEDNDPNAAGDANNARIQGRIFKFDQWRLGGKSALRRNQEVMMQGIGERNPEGRAEDLVSLAKLEISNARGAEAVGYLQLAGEEYQPFRQSPEYLALLGAAYALNHQYDVAFRVLMVPQLNDFEELRYWRAYALAELDDWSQAGDVLPENTRFLRSYPKELRLPLTVILAEVYLRKGDVERAEESLKIIEAESDDFSPHYEGAMIYLKGELMRQRKNNQGALTQWNKLLKHPDDFYRTRARLAVTDLRYSLKEITVDKAIDDLERLRFSWRGDDLETTVNFKLGRLYMENKLYIKGLSVLRKAVALSEGTGMGRQMAAYMRAEYKDLFLGEKAGTLTPLQLAMIYEEFSELTPSGEEADMLMQHLAERLVEVDLLGRAIKILTDQVENRSSGKEQVELALRLAGIQLINNANKDGLKTLNLAERAINQLPILSSVPYRRDMNLLRARGLSRDGRSRDALVLLNNMKQDDDAVRLKADVAWTGGHWNDAAEALEELVTRFDIKPNQPIGEAEANMILNWSVALSLSGNRHVITNVRSQYAEQMQKTSKGDLFEVVTRPRQNAILADRDTIGRIVSEVDIFSDFLESYRAPAANKNP